jgi:hypothetical protein
MGKLELGPGYGGALMMSGGVVCRKGVGCKKDMMYWKC